MPYFPAANYRAYRTELEAMDEILRLSGLDEFMLKSLLEQRREQAADDAAYSHGLEKFILQTRSALRISILRAHKSNASVRDLEITLADSNLEQWFCFIENFGTIRAPGKSTIDRARKLFTPELHGRAFAMLLQKAASAPEVHDPLLGHAINLLGFEIPVDLLETWYDSTCHCPDIHFPVDWVQLGDCCRTLLKAIGCIRKHGVKNRMPRGGTEKLLHDLNQLGIAMGNARRRKNSSSERKKNLRKMKHFADRMARHARTHRDLLVKHREGKTSLSPAQANLVIGRIESVLEILPQVRKQAHERIIGERRVPNDEKILSIYEPSTMVIVRGKSGSEVEYGNQLLLGENRDGLIVYWKLSEDVRSDSSRLLEAIENTEKNIGAKLGKVCADRGFSDEKTQERLGKSHPGTIDHICPKSPLKLEGKKADPDFRSSQKRRAQTEARVAIVTNTYQRGRSLSRGLASQRQELHWVMLAHNLRLLARRLVAQREAHEREQRRRKKAA